MAGASMKDIKLRIKSVESTMQITKAMELVASSKLRRAKERQEKARPYFTELRSTLDRIEATTTDFSSPYQVKRPVERQCMIVIAGDRGLAGGYNANICRLLERSIEDKEKALIVTIGKKGREYFARRGFELGDHFEIESSLPSYGEVSRIVKGFTDLKTEGQVDDLYVVYTSFQNTISQKPVILKLLPLALEDLDMPADPARMSMMNYEPGEETVLDYIIPKYISGIVYGALAESFASEEGARMTAMDSATDNAQEIIENLTLKYNQARQSHITQELTEIVNGAAALEN